MSERQSSPGQPPERPSGVPPELEYALTPHNVEGQTPLEDFKDALRVHWRFILEGKGAGEAVTFAQTQLAEARETARANGVNVELVEAEFEKEIIGEYEEPDHI
jgi:hypothetical protein